MTPQCQGWQKTPTATPGWIHTCPCRVPGTGMALDGTGWDPGSQLCEGERCQRDMKRRNESPALERAPLSKRAEVIHPFLTAHIHLRALHFTPFHPRLRWREQILCNLTSKALHDSGACLSGRSLSSHDSIMTSMAHKGTLLCRAHMDLMFFSMVPPIPQKVLVCGHSPGGCSRITGEAGGV